MATMAGAGKETAPSGPQNRPSAVRGRGEQPVELLVGDHLVERPGPDLGGEPGLERREPGHPVQVSTRTLVEGPGDQVRAAPPRCRSGTAPAARRPAASPAIRRIRNATRASYPGWRSPRPRWRARRGPPGRSTRRISRDGQPGVGEEHQRELAQHDVDAGRSRSAAARRLPSTQVTSGAVRRATASMPSLGSTPTTSPSGTDPVHAQPAPARRSRSRRRGRRPPDARSARVEQAVPATARTVPARRTSRSSSAAAVLT